jgi:predicted Zn-dependent protease
MLSTKPAPVRFVARLMGGQTDKAKGISELRITAAHGRYLANFAKLLLAVSQIRENNKAEARQLLGELARDFPQNPLYAHQLSRIQ